MKNTIPEIKNMALVVVDVQNKFLDKTSDLTKAIYDHMDIMNETIEVFRKYSRPVIFVYYDGETHSITYDGPDKEGLIKGISKKDTDLEVHKQFMNSFRETNLEKVIKDHNCNSIAIIGIVSQYCVLSTYFGAFDKDLIPYMIHGGSAATDENTAKAVEQVCKTLTTKELEIELHKAMRS